MRGFVYASVAAFSAEECNMNVAPANWSKQSHLAGVATREGVVETGESCTSSRVSEFDLIFTSLNSCICLNSSLEWTVAARFGSPSSPSGLLMVQRWCSDLGFRLTELSSGKSMKGAPVCMMYEKLCIVYSLFT